MGVVRLSEKLLKAMAKCYSVNGQTLFTIDNLCDLFPKETKESLSDAAWLLEDDGLVSVFCADDVAYTVTIHCHNRAFRHPSGISVPPSTQYLCQNSPRGYKLSRLVPNHLPSSRQLSVAIRAGGFLRAPS